jgi:glc operon protein GlcG
MSSESMSRRDAIAVGAGLTTVALAAGMFAAAPSAEAQTAGGLGATTKPTMSLLDARALLDAAESRSLQINVPMYVLVVDESGREKASIRMDGNGLASLTLVPLKAHTALSFRAATEVLADRFGANAARLSSFTGTGEFVFVGGGLPIVVNNKLLGAIGVGGGSPEQDADVAKFALDALLRRT